MANKQRLIDANRLLRDPYFQEDRYPESHLLRMAINEQRTVDAVEVVRCKDCEFWGGVTFGNVCRRWSAPLAGMKNCTKPDDFCSYGERKMVNLEDIVDLDAQTKANNEAMRKVIAFMAGERRTDE